LKTRKIELTKLWAQLHQLCHFRSGQLRRHLGELGGLLAQLGNGERCLCGSLRRKVELLGGREYSEHAGKISPKVPQTSSLRRLSASGGHALDISGSSLYKHRVNERRQNVRVRPAADYDIQVEYLDGLLTVPLQVMDVAIGGMGLV